MKGETCGKLHVIGLGFGLGITWAISMFVLGLLVIYLDAGRPMLDLMASMYYGYDATLLGSVVGGFWGFVDGFIGGVLIAFFYNLACRCKCFGCKTE